jgi:signal transduction histidine kinase
MLDGILVSRARADNVDYRFSIISAVNHLIDALLPYAEAKSISIAIESDISDTYPRVKYIVFDSIFSNILCNSIKYSHSGSLILVFLSKAQTGAYVRVTVKDEGPGIPQEILSREMIGRDPGVFKWTVNPSSSGTGANVRDAANPGNHVGANARDAANPDNHVGANARDSANPDNHEGLYPQMPGSGLGLRIIADGIEAAGGKMAVLTGSGGTEIELLLPIIEV